MTDKERALLPKEIHNLGFVKDHNPKSKEIYEFVAELDFTLGDDYFCFKSGGDCDNGEILMDYLDAYFNIHN